VDADRYSWLASAHDLKTVAILSLVSLTTNVAEARLPLPLRTYHCLNRLVPPTPTTRLSSLRSLRMDEPDVEMSGPVSPLSLAIRTTPRTEVASFYPNCKFLSRNTWHLTAVAGYIEMSDITSLSLKGCKMRKAGDVYIKDLVSSCPRLREFAFEEYQDFLPRTHSGFQKPISPSTITSLLQPVAQTLEKLHLGLMTDDREPYGSTPGRLETIKGFPMLKEFSIDMNLIANLYEEDSLENLIKNCPKASCATKCPRS